MRLIPLRTPVEFQPGDDLIGPLLNALSETGVEPRPGDVLVVAQKIISKTEGRLVPLDQVRPGLQARALARMTGKDPRLVQLILEESRRVIRAAPGVILVQHRLGYVCANAGIDRSNVPSPDGREWVTLLPQDPDASAQSIARAFAQHYGMSIGVMIIDSHGRAWRMGTVGVVLGLYNVPPLKDYRGQLDRQRRPLQVTQQAIADELAAAASLLMGQGDESVPAVWVQNPPFSLAEGRSQDLIRPEERDLFLQGPIYG